ncbi:SET domain-containing protein [Favolaschia claudopus]|uniref:SET domain-containing protein n=1 Tax=Favolaschia claudopus TaxID=2862362 RepID=A0AAW0AXP0_9AGAR
MLAAPKSKESILPHQAPQAPPSSKRTSRLLLGCVLTLAWLCWNRSRTSNSAWSATLQPFYAHVKTVQNICPVVDGPGISHSGHIGLKGDSEDSPKRLFFWYFEAEQDAANAPIIMTIGGGPGTSGMMNPIMAQGPCLSAENGTTKPNPNRWTEHYNLLALDHPVGVGFSYGRMVNNSRDAAIDTYDFLQKFFRLYPHLSQNKFVLSGGSYGGTYVPHIATVIHEQNLALAAGARHINLESLMLSNPMSDATSHFTWFLQTTCHGPVEMYNASTCSHMYERLPACLDSIRIAEQSPEWNAELRKNSHELCWYLRSGDMHGVVGEDYRKKCVSDDPLGCLPPNFGWTNAFFNRSDVKTALLGVDAHRNFTHLSEQVFNEFYSYGDTMQSAYLLYEPLLRSGIRLLHYVGSKDANCNYLQYHGIMSFLKLIKSPFQDEFLRAPDVPWPTAEEAEAEATVRVVGEGAGNMTWILIDGGGHFIAHDQPKLVKSIVEHWVENVPFN